MDKKINSAYSDALLRLAVIENHQRDLAAIPPRKELERTYSFSPDHEMRMEKLFAKSSKKHIHPIKVLRRAAAAVIIAVALMFSALLTNAEVRASVWNAVVEWYSEFTRFVFNSSEFDIGVEPGDENSRWYPSHLPDGFVETNSEILGDITYIDFGDSSGDTIVLSCTKETQALAVDNEHSRYSSTTNDGVNYHVFAATSEEYLSKVLWERDGYSFFLESCIASDKLLEIAFSVERK
ncbi:MAG: DUF4367 domain-containing protein [Oscillospiraceae bacterium]|nr:DUF4367 domain-containing protein [Oscillospiraceae bacterium]